MAGNAHLPARNSRYTLEPHTAFEAPIPNTLPRKYHEDFLDSKTRISSGWNGSLKRQCEALAVFLAGDVVPGTDRMTPFLLLVELGLEAVSGHAKDKLKRQPDPPRRAGGEREFRGMLSPFVQAGSQVRLEKELWGPESRAR
ncbi:zinc finger protein 630 isoform X1 [Prionailurus iriomotensis]